MFPAREEAFGVPLCVFVNFPDTALPRSRKGLFTKPKSKVTLGLVSLNGRISTGEGMLPSHRLMRLFCKQLEVCIIPTNLGSEGRGAEEVAQKLLRVE